MILFDKHKVFEAASKIEEEDYNHFERLSEAFKYIGLAILKERAKRVMRDIGKYPVAWLTPAEVLDLIDMIK